MVLWCNLELYLLTYFKVTSSDIPFPLHISERRGCCCLVTSISIFCFHYVFQITNIFHCVRIQGLDTAEGLLLFGREYFYIPFSLRISDHQHISLCEDSRPWHSRGVAAVWSRVFLYSVFTTYFRSPTYSAVRGFKALTQPRGCCCLVTSISIFRFHYVFQITNIFRCAENSGPWHSRGVAAVWSRVFLRDRRVHHAEDQGDQRHRQSSSRVSLFRHSGCWCKCWDRMV